MSNETLKHALAAEFDPQFDAIEAISDGDLDEIVGGACMTFTCGWY